MLDDKPITAKINAATPTPATTPPRACLSVVSANLQTYSKRSLWLLSFSTSTARSLTSMSKPLAMPKNSAATGTMAKIVK